MDDKIQLLSKFKNALSKFVGTIIKKFPEEQEFILVKTFIDKHMPMEELMGRFICQILIDRRNIERRYDGFFKKHDNMNGRDGCMGVNNDIYKRIKSIYLSEHVDDNDRESCWKWFDLFVKIVDQYYIKFGEVKGWEVDHTHKVFIELDKKRSEYKRNL
tara:strand:+ start:882 stop:1358 length:477 start_codon:yes stop_codon:yes gene_type:complete